MDDKWLWDHMADMQAGLYALLKNALREKVKAGNKSPLFADGQNRLENESGFIAGELVNIVAYSMGKEIANATGDAMIVKELDQYQNNIMKDPALRSHLSDKQIERAELYGVVYYLVMKGRPADEISRRTGISHEELGRVTNDVSWFLGE